MTTQEQLQGWLDAPEGSQLEFKSATVGGARRLARIQPVSQSDEPISPREDRVNRV